MDLVTDTGRTIPALRIRKRDVINRTIALYGPSGSGKTHIVKHLLDLIRGDVEQIVVVSPTEMANRSFTNYVPSPLIHYGFTAPDPKNPRKRISGPKAAEIFLQSIWDRQLMLVNTFLQANDIKTLRLLLGRVAADLRAEAAPILANVQALKAQYEKALHKKYPAGSGDLITKLDELKDIIEAKEGHIIKDFVRRDLSLIWARRQELSESERRALTYLDLKPELVLVLDDCAADLKPLFKKPEMRRYFYQNRHYRVTTIICFQDDTDLDTNLRKNVFCSIFCTEVVCRSFFARQSNGFNKEDRKEVDEIIPQVYDVQGGHRYRKIVYRRDDPSGAHYYHFTSPSPKEQMFCAPSVAELCRAMKAPDASVDTDNPFYRNFQAY